jgi:predicted acetyltransferase
MTDTYPIRTAEEDEFPAFYAVGEQAFNSHWPTEPSLQIELATFEADRSLAALDGDRMVGTATACTFQMAVPGAMTGAAGVTGVSVLPSHRRRGILSALMRRQLADIRDRGEVIAALYASESGIYGRYGYGVAADNLRFTIRRGEGALLRRDPALRAGVTAGELRLRLAEPQEPKAELAKVHDAVLPGRPGMLARDDRWWDHVLADPEFARGGTCPLRCLIAEDDAGPRGYALYSVKPEWGEDAVPAGVLYIKELLAADPPALAAIWSDLLTRDLVSEIQARMRPVDDPLLHMLADRRRARALITDGLWIRLTDVPGALARRRYASEVDVVIEVRDDLLPENAGRWRLQAGGTGEQAGGTREEAGASCQRTSAAADIVLPVLALGAAYLGGRRLGALAAAGQAAELRPGALGALSAAMSWDPAPWCPTAF